MQTLWKNSAVKIPKVILMKLKNKIAALSTLLILQSLNTVNAASVDTEMAILAAEQDRTGEVVEPFDPKTLKDNKNKSKTKKEIKAEEKRLEEERKAAKKKIKEERKKSRAELNGKSPISKNPAPNSRTQKNNSTVTTQKNSSPVKEIPAVTDNPAIIDNSPVSSVNPKPVEEIQPIQNINQLQNFGMQNPTENHASFVEIVQNVNFTPLYIPKKNGYTITSMTTIDNAVAEIRYSSKINPSISLNVRTYHRTDGEELKDISGIHGVKWRKIIINGLTVYIVKISENQHAAAWAVGNYTFSAYAENISFAEFYSIVSDELVDLSQHYYIAN